MADLEAYKDKFGDSGQRVLQNAMNESKRRDQNYVAVEHIISGLSKEEPDLFNTTMRNLALDPLTVARAIENRLDSGRQHVGKGFRIAPDTTELFKRAMERARSRGRKSIEATDIFDALSKPDSLFTDMLRGLGANPEVVEQQVRANVNERDQKEEQYRSIFEATSDALLICDLEDAHVVEANPAACRMYGYSYEELDEDQTMTISAKANSINRIYQSRTTRSGRSGKARASGAMSRLAFVVLQRLGVQ